MNAEVQRLIDTKTPCDIVMNAPGDWMLEFVGADLWYGSYKTKQQAQADAVRMGIRVRRVESGGLLKG